VKNKLKIRSAKRALIFILIFILTVASLKVVPASLTVSTNKPVYTTGNTVIISGTTSPSTAVGIQVKSPSGVTVWIDSVTSSSSGSFSSSFVLRSDAELGTYTVYASTSSETATSTFSVVKLSVSTDKSTYVRGEVVTISGSISPTTPNAGVGIEVRDPNGVVVWIDSVITDSSSKFSSSFTLRNDTTLGTYIVYASYSGIVATCTFLVQTLPPPPPPPPPKVSLISLLASNYNPKIGETINLYGEISPALSSSTNVTIYIAQEGGNFNVLATVTTDSVGHYNYSWKAEKAGVFYLKSYWKGNLTLPEAWSNVIEVKVSKLPSTITCLLSNASIVPKSSVTIFGKISAQVSSTVNILYSINGGASWSTLASVTSGADGSYSYVWSNVPEGIYLIKASWPGNEVYEGATSSSVVLSVVKGTTSISLQVARATVTKGESIELSGSLTPSLPSITVTITYAKPSGTSVTHSVTTDSNGKFSDSISADETGNWRITASWPGNEAYEGSSTTATVTVNPSFLDQILMPLIIVLILIVVLLLLVFGLLR
jgi:hypothetical protein